MTLLDPSQLASELQIPKGTLDNWAYQHKGPAFVRVGRHRRYRREDVDSWVASRVQGGSDAA